MLFRSYLRADTSPGRAVTFDMEPGDVLLFHGDQLHGSEINSTNSTRHVISFRICLEKPVYPNGHYHHYAHSSLAGGALNAVAEVPQNLAWSFLRWRFKRVLQIAGLAGSKEGSVRAKTSAPQVDADGGLPVAALEGGAIAAVSAKACVARLANGEVRAFGRYCPHQGADLSLGFVKGDKLMCPWHNLPLDPTTGETPCESLKKLKTFECEVRDDRVYVTDTRDTAASRP